MNSISRWLRQQRDSFLLGAMLIIMSGGIYSMGSVYSWFTQEPALTIIEHGGAGDSLRSIPEGALKIESVIRLPLDYPVYTFEVADHQTILINRSSDALSGIRLSALQIEDGEVSDIADNVDYGIVMRPDQQVIYIQYGEDWDSSKRYVYNWRQKQSVPSPASSVNPLQVVGDQYMLSFGGDTFKLLKLLPDGTSRDSWTFGYEQLIQAIASAAGTSADQVFIDFESISTLQSPEGEEYLYMMAMNEEKYGIYRLNLKDMSQAEELMNNPSGLQFTLLEDGMMLLSGAYEGRSGLYLYDLSLGTAKLLTEAQIRNYAINLENGRLAYFTEQDSRNELHVAYLEDGELMSDTVIYRNIDNMYELKLYDNYLFVSSAVLERTELYRFTISGW
ncbi:hypothetical protein PA598K_05691 [Paenibacillus sp. 598K]|uniref:hypothetical protein n=1 Tax=Paenibacillus sp. 598K TaxID=1117987 RepID=UPI000FF98294|nr:hypothetical protein [Paenibacillus sp. 598K]GBF77160.1 hypothetical protein PA598K_05691 [Paenibacillus sp. 598K]